MAVNNDFKVESWYDQILKEEPCDEYLFQSYNWDAPKIDQEQIDLSDKNEYENYFNLNFGDQDLKFCFPNWKSDNYLQFAKESKNKKPCIPVKQELTNVQAQEQPKMEDNNAAVMLINQWDSSQKSVCSNGRRMSTDNESNSYDSVQCNSKASESCGDISQEQDCLNGSENAGFKSKLDKDERDDGNFVPENEDLKLEDDPDFDYKAPRKQTFEYNKRKDVILKTILRKWRRTLQDKFNDLTGYFPNRKMQGHQFLKDSIVKFYDSIQNKPEQLDLVFYIGAMLYPQEMSRGVDCFFESDKNERVKYRKIYRAKIQKVHDVLYRYSHEKMDYFVSVPELSFLYSIFYKEETKKKEEDIFYMNGATEIFERCQETLATAGVNI